ncbi:Protein archease [uncultured archaeon]|nr:Protein archease [uncultured archaeon]
MQKYKFLEHTADMMFEAYGKSYPEALQNAAEALFFVIGKAAAKEKVSLSVSAENIEELTVFALSDLLSASDTKEMVFSKLVVKEFDPKKLSLSLEAYGEKRRPQMSVKAVTYHELLVKEENGQWTIRILLDV